MKLKVYNISGKETGRDVSLAKDVFGKEVSEHAIYLAVKQYLANQRQGTHKAKERAEIAGSTKKIKKQKGTGTARFGNIKNPIFRSGGRIFGPRPRNYGFKLNKKVKNSAAKSALSQKAKDDRLMVVEDFTFEAPGTKQYAEMLRGFELYGSRTMLVTDDEDKNVYLSARNLPKTEVTTASRLNTYDIVNCSKLIFTEEALKKVEERLK